jgi:hypothetical protein
MNYKQHLLANPPLDSKGNRIRGSSSKDAFWCGYDGGPKRGEHGSNTRLAWEAGKAYAKQHKAQ